jgi:sterol desaturase/sphingolipid hydroxylase (fatty acid hydroxylase superfamily)
VEIFLYTSSITLYAAYIDRSFFNLLAFGLTSTLTLLYFTLYTTLSYPTVITITVFFSFLYFSASSVAFHTYNSHVDVELPIINMVFNDGFTHILHHRFPRHNYGIMFSIWDRMMGTYMCPYAQRERDQAKAKAKLEEALSPAEPLS